MPIGAVMGLPPVYGNAGTEIRKWAHPPLTDIRPDIVTLLEALVECTTMMPVYR
jgi:hypothetical protein